jgi:ATP-binding cassette subfamily B (MDR/TAP) protein 7
MLIHPLARAASRPGLRSSSLRPHPLHHGIRVFTSSPLHRKDAHGQRPKPGSTPAIEATKPAADPAAAKVAKSDPLLQEQVLTNKEQRKADWAIMKEMSAYLWPKDNLGTRFRVGISLGLLVGAKLLNVQVPFYFKSIVDAMNIDFAAVGGTATTVAGSMIIACKLDPTMHPRSTLAETPFRWNDSYWRDCIPRTPKCRLRQCGSEGYTQGRLQCL